MNIHASVGSFSVVSVLFVHGLAQKLIMEQVNDETASMNGDLKHNI